MPSGGSRRARDVERDNNTFYAGNNWLSSCPTISRVDHRDHPKGKDDRPYPTRYEV
jgi:hypothetical protein